MTSLEEQEQEKTKEGSKREIQSIQSINQSRLEFQTTNRRARQLQPMPSLTMSLPHSVFDRQEHYQGGKKKPATALNPPIKVLHRRLLISSSDKIASSSTGHHHPCLIEVVRAIVLQESRREHHAQQRGLSPWHSGVGWVASRCVPGGFVTVWKGFTTTLAKPWCRQG